MSVVPKAAAGAGCSFFSVEPSDSFAPSDFSSDEQLMVDMAEQFCRGEVLTVQDRLEKQEEGLMPSLIRKAGELGFCGIDSPDLHGGLGLGKNISARILEHLALDASFSVTIGVTSGIAQFGLAAFGTEDQKSRYLPQLASGEWIGAYCLSEPNSGTDALSLTTRAVRDGDDWLITGTKMWISNAMWANLFLVMAKADGDKITAFLVEKDFPGLTIEREEHKLGLKGSSTARVTFEDCRVPDANRLYEIGKGHHIAFNSLNIGRFKLGAMSLGPAREAIKVSAEYALDRKQFGQPISSFGLIRKKFADMACRYFAAESMMYRTGALIDQALGSADGTVKDLMRATELNSVECSMCKVATTEAQALIADEALQVFGGYGFTEEFPVARIYRDSRVSRIYEGTNEINRQFIADRLRRRSISDGLSLAGTGNSFISELAAKAMAIESEDQELMGAQSDLVLLHYAEQSARLRASKEGEIAQAAYDRYLNWANSQAAFAFQTVTGKSVGLPEPKPMHTDTLAEAILEAGRPV